MSHAELFLTHCPRAFSLARPQVLQPTFRNDSQRSRLRLP